MDYTLLDWAKQSDMPESQQALVYFFADNPILNNTLKFVDTNGQMEMKIQNIDNIGSTSTRELNGTVSGSSSSNVERSAKLAIFSSVLELDWQYDNPDEESRQQSIQSQANGWHFVRQFFKGDSTATASTFDGLNKIASEFTNVIPITSGTGLTVDSSAANARTLFSALDMAIQRTSARHNELVIFAGMDVISTMKTAANLMQNSSVFQYANDSLNNQIQMYNGIKIIPIPYDMSNNVVIGFDDDSNNTASIYVCHMNMNSGLVGLKKGNWKYKEMDLAVGKRTFAMELPMGIIGLQNKCVQRVTKIQRSSTFTPTS